MKFIYSKLFEVFIFALICAIISQTTYYRQFHETTEDVIAAIVIGTLTWTALLSVIYIPYSLIVNKRRKNKISKPLNEEEKNILLKISSELKNNNLDEALFVESKMKANGDINKAEAIYIKERKKILIEELSKEKILKEEEGKKNKNNGGCLVLAILIVGIGFLIYISNA